MASIDQPDNNSDQLSGSIGVTFDNTTLLCEPCLEDRPSRHLPAEGYCVDCSHYLCVECYTCHRRPVPCRHHQLLDKHEMPRTKPAPVYKDECTGKCEKHGDKIIEFYCEGCKQFGCTICVATKHTKDKCEVEYIPTLAKKFYESQDYKTFKKNIDSLVKKSNDITEDAKRKLKDVDKQAEKALCEIRTLRKEVDNHFDRLEKEVTDKVTKARSSHKKKIEDISKQNAGLSTDVETIQASIYSKESRNQKCELFADAKKLAVKLEEYGNRVKKNNLEDELTTITFIPSHTLSRLLQDKSQTFGFCASFGSKINVEAPEDKTDPNISGIATLSGGRIAVADYINGSIKIIDAKQNIVLTSMLIHVHLYQHQYFQFGITTVSDAEIAVVQKGNIEIYSVINDIIKLVKTVQIKNTRLNYSSLVYFDTKFIGLSESSPVKVCVVDMNGCVVKSFSVPSEMDYYRSHTSYIAVSPDKALAYMNGHCVDIHRYKLAFDDSGQQHPKTNFGLQRGVAVSNDGTVFVCIPRNRLISVFTPDLQETTSIGCPFSCRSAFVPRTLAYCQTENKLYVGLQKKGHILVLDI